MRETLANKITGDCNVKLETCDIGGKIQGYTTKHKNECSSVTDTQKEMVNMLGNLMNLIVQQCAIKSKCT